MAMQIRNYTLRFITPAFMGNADQSGQWRTPPVKALLRQWWRVAYAARQQGSVDVKAMLHAEGQLFGVAADGEESSHKSAVRIRLSQWSMGRQTSWAGLDDARVQHPEVKNKEGRLAPVGAQLYLGYGPLVFQQGQTSMKSRAAIQGSESCSLSLAYPSSKEASCVDAAVWLMHHYGALGGRSRNGWGSFALSPADAATPAVASELDPKLTIPWQDALKLDWPHSIGTDEKGPLIWQTEEPMADWKAVMRRLAEIKIGLRTQSAFSFTSGKNASQPDLRHWLSYPVTNHSVREWGDARLPNSLRFKVRAERDGKLRGVIFHVPCAPPEKFRPSPKALVTVWTKVHEFLQDPAQGLQRIPA